MRICYAIHKKSPLGLLTAFFCHRRENEWTECIPKYPRFQNDGIICPQSCSSWVTNHPSSAYAQCHRCRNDFRKNLRQRPILPPVASRMKSVCAGRRWLDTSHRALLLPPPQTMAGDAEGSHQSRLATRAASVLVFANLQLDVVWTGATSMVFAPSLVQLVRLIVAALEADESFEAHLRGLCSRSIVVLNSCLVVCDTH